ncbi:hypothetical protein BRC83_00105 [Halobacteriales archaeon QS_1_68_17]|nr:MAG: hypothetical protein BRC83_00105 [Halobacteriales archaeon QS_1_68_17]
MGFGSTAKKLQKVADAAEDLYAKMNDVRQQLVELRETVETTSDQVESLERDLAEQRAIVEALAAEQGVEVDSVLTDAAIEEVDGDAPGTQSGEPTD